MLDPVALSSLSPLAHGRPLLGGCLVRVESNTKHSARQVQQVGFAIGVFAFVVAAYYALAKLGIVWIGVVFAVGPVLALLFKRVGGVTAKPKVLRLLVTDQTLLLVDCDGTDVPPTVIRALPRTTIDSVNAKGTRLSMISAGRKVTLLADPSDAEQLAALLR
jgi:hypothetical protein